MGNSFGGMSSRRCNSLPRELTISCCPEAVHLCVNIKRNTPRSTIRSESFDSHLLTKEQGQIAASQAEVTLSNRDYTHASIRTVSIIYHRRRHTGTMILDSESTASNRLWIR